MIQKNSSLRSIKEKDPAFSKEFALIDIGGLLDLEEIQDCYENVPLDVFVPDDSRRKSIIRLHVHKRSRIMLAKDHEPLYQDAVYNYNVYGADSRPYPEMEKRLAALLDPVFGIFAACGRLDSQHEILAQAQRVTTDDARTGETSREGWHTDGAIVLGILVINRTNVTGGTSMLSYSRDGSNPVFAQTLMPGELLLIDDRKLWHFSTSIKQLRPGAKASRDVLLLTYPSYRQPKQIER